eukprot:gene21447-27780_t
MPNVADELRTMYVESMSKTLQNLFKAYYNQLTRLDLVVATKNDVIVIEEASLKSMFTQKISMSKRIDTFSLGERDKILDQIESDPILIHLALAEAQKYPYEALIRPVDLTPHYVTRRYSELVASILTLQTGFDAMGIGGGGETMLSHDLQIIRTEMIGLLDRLSLLIVNKKDRIVFLINNFDQILSLFQERRIAGEELQRFEDLLMQQREFYAEEEVNNSFSRLITFVVQTEKEMASLASNESNTSKTNSGIILDDTIVESLVREFASNWRNGIQQIHDNVLAYFANFRSGTEILKQVLTQLLLYYTRFQDIIKKSYTKQPTFTRDIVSTATILMEIKKYSRTF